MIDRLPFIRPFNPTGLRWRLVDAVIEGAGGLGTPTPRISTDGGGWWVAEFGEMKVSSPAHHRAMRAMAIRLRGGVRIDVPFVELAPTGGLTSVPFAGGVTFSDGSEFGSGAVSAVLEEAVALNDDAALIRITTGQLLTGGDVFSIERPLGFGSGLYATDRVADLGDGVWSVTIGPQFRASHPAGTALNFNDPHCVMRLEDPEGAMWPRLTRGWHGTASARLVEALT